MAFDPFTKDEQPTMENFNKKLWSLRGIITEVHVGTYIGTGTSTAKIDLEFEPKAVITSLYNGSTVYYISSYIIWYGGLCLRDAPMTQYNDDTSMRLLYIEGNGFVVANNSPGHMHLNEANNRYRYIAFS